MSANNLAKSAKEKENNNNDLCKKHAPHYTRSICPSKLSKRELEDLYYTLLENNLELKRTINAQNDKNRILSTKVQRMTMQSKTYVNKECCAAGKAVINEQKAAISDLTKANEALADRVRRLSTQLCTAKQFLKQNPNGKHCYKCYVNTTTSVKNLSTTSLQNTAVQLDHEPPSTRTAETNTTEDDVEKDEKGDAEKVCNENRCRTTMEQFKQKIEELEEELAKTHNEYSSRMTQLESQVSQLQAAVRGRSEQAIRARDSLELTRMHQAEECKAELETALSVERKKTAELEMRLRAAEMSQQVAKTVEDHLSSAHRLEEKQLRQSSVERHSVCSNLITADGPLQVILKPVNSTPNKTPNQLIVPDDRLCKSDDSGYVDQRRQSDIDNEDMYKTNQELLRRISEMEAQLEAVKLMATTTEKGNAEQETSSCTRSFDQYYIKSDEDQENSGQNTPKQAQMSISEPAAKSSKELVHELQSRKERYSSERRKSRLQTETLSNTYDINVPSKDCECPYREKYDPDNAVSNITRRGSKNILPKKRAADANNTTLEKNVLISEKNECDEHLKTCTIQYNDKEDDSKPCSTKEMFDRRDIFSISLQNASDGLKTQPKDNITKGNPKDMENDNITKEKPKNVENLSTETTATKRKRVSLVIFENGADNRVSSEIEPTTPSQSMQKESINIKSLEQTIEPRKIKSDDREQPTHLALSVRSNSTEKGASLSDKKAEYSSRIILKTSDNSDGDVKTNKDETYNVNKNVDMKDDKALILEKDAGGQKDKVLIIESENLERYKYDNYSLMPMRSQEKYNAEAVRTNVVADYKAAKEILKSGSYVNEKVQFDNNAKIGGILRINEFDICQHHATICTCPEKPSPSLTLFRSCSGSQTLATLPSGGRFRRCICSERAVRYSCGPSLKDKPIGTSTPKQERAPTPASPHTYTVDSGNFRADSPANTEHEISVMTDLPSEKEDDRMSPGEQRPTSVSAETCSLGYQLSEGEVPNHNHYQQDTTSKSLGEVGRSYEKKPDSYGEQKSPAQQMEATLQAISQELELCRSLLLSQRPAEVM